VKPFIVVKPFLEDLPEGWAVHRLRRVSELIEETNSDADAPLLSLTIGGELLPRADDVQPPSAEYLLKYGLVRVGDLVVNPMWLTGGSIGVSAAEGAVSPEYRIYRFGRDIYPRFIHHLVRSDPFMHQYRLLVRAETTFDRRVTKEDFRELPLAVPPMEAQRLIAHYLDTETAHIDEIIAKKQRIIELLAARRRQFWAESLDKMRCGTSKRIPLGYCVDEVRDSNTGGRETNRLSLSYGRVVAKDIDSPEGLLPESFETYTIVRPGDVVLRLTDLQNDQRSLRVGQVQESGIITSAYVTLRPRPGIDSSFLALVLRGLDARKEFYALGAGVRQSLKFGELRRVELPVPSAEIQRETVLSDARQSELILRLQGRLERQIELLREHRKALITATVTGWLDVPGVAA
jgi:type I restriction enzyme S subunit